MARDPVCGDCVCEEHGYFAPVEHGPNEPCPSHLRWHAEQLYAWEQANEKGSSRSSSDR